MEALEWQLEALRRGFWVAAQDHMVHACRCHRCIGTAWRMSTAGPVQRPEAMAAELHLPDRQLPRSPGAMAGDG